MESWITLFQPKIPSGYVGTNNTIKMEPEFDVDNSIPFIFYLTCHIDFTG